MIGKTVLKCTTWPVLVGTKCLEKSGFALGIIVLNVVNRPFRIASIVPMPIASRTTMFCKSTP